MKKSVIVTLCNIVLVSCLMTCLLLFHPYSSHIEAATFNQETSLQQLERITDELTTEIQKIQDNMSTYEEALNNCTSRMQEISKEHDTLENALVDYYMDKLRDPDYFTTYNENYIYYTAAENLGQIGKPAIPKLIERLSTTDDYERTLVLYALLLASQADNVKAFAGNDYIHTSLDFDTQSHPEQIKTAMAWWEKYKSYF